MCQLCHGNLRSDFNGLRTNFWKLGFFFTVQRRCHSSRRCPVVAAVAAAADAHDGGGGGCCVLDHSFTPTIGWHRPGKN